MVNKTTMLILFALLSGAYINAQNLVYKPKNPAFGGETFNYQWLQSSAQAQDTYRDTRPSTTTTPTRNTLNDFSETLNRQVLSSLSRQIAISQFGEDGLQPGSYTIGNFSVDVSNSLDGLVVDIVDQSTGQSTQVIVPFL